jgi:hypothetical protein
MNRQIRVGVREYWSWKLGKGLESARVEEGVGHAGLQMVKVGKADDKLGRQHVVIDEAIVRRLTIRQSITSGLSEMTPPGTIGKRLC